MSGIVALYHRNGASVPPALLHRLAEPLRHRGPDGFDVAVCASVVLGHQHFWITPEEVGERQPLVDADTQLHVAFDGRVDNRKELMVHLGWNGADGKAPSDAALLSRAYERWGKGCFERLLGSFAAVIYDARRRLVVCARDALGDRTLFYYLDHRLLVMGSEERAVLAHPAVSARLDEQRLAEHFAVWLPSPGRTFFAEVRELMPAQGLTVSDHRVHAWRHWSGCPEARLRYRAETDYAAHFRSLLGESVRCRLRAATAPVAMMSGGLDSPAVAALAARELAARRPPGRLRTVSWVFDELVQCDERAYMEPMIQQYGLDAVHILADDAWPLCNLKSGPLNPNTPIDNAYRELKTRVYHAAAASGSRVLLSGAFGDALYAGAGDWLLDLLGEKRFGIAARHLFGHVRRLGLWRGMADPSIRRALGIRRPRYLRRGSQKPVWLTASAWRLLEDGPQPWPPASATARRPCQWQRTLGTWAGQDPIESFHANHAGIELADPFRDRRLVEFMLAIPAHQLYNGIGYKPVLRHAMEGILPEKVRLAGRHGTLEVLFRRGVAERGSGWVRDLLGSPSDVLRRYVDPVWLRRAVLNPTNSQRVNYLIWQCLSFELWLGRREDAGLFRALAPEFSQCKPLEVMI
jgi:asparagine synthase (glutamine-hydrolysing)